MCLYVTHGCIRFTFHCFRNSVHAKLMHSKYVSAIGIKMGFLSLDISRFEA
jgi:hypothetical protein